MKTINRRILCLLLILCLCLSAAACGKKNGNEPAPVTTPETPAAATTAAEAPPATPSSGGKVENLVVGTTGQPETTSILSQSGALGKFNYNNITYANFLYPDENNNMQPYFLDSYKISEDGYELDMTFPTTAIWHDGKPVTVDDVVFTFEFRRDVMNNKSLENLSEVRVNGENSVTLVFSKPDAYYFVKNSTLTMFVIPKHIWKDIEDYSAYKEDDAAIGCGPYKLVEVDRDAGIMYLEAVPENAFLGELTVESITLKSYPSQDTMLMALANGEIDLIYEYAAPVSHTLLDLIKGNPDVDPGQSGYIGCNQVTFCMNRAANLEHAFREALVKSLDWNLICQLSNGDYGEIPGSGLLPSSCPGYDDSLWKMYQDVDEANKLLDDAGFVDANGDGFRDLPDGSSFQYKVTAQYAVKKQELLNRVGEVIVSSLNKVGVDAYFDQESLASSEANGQMFSANDFDIYIGYTTSGVATYRTAFWYFVPGEVTGSGKGSPRAYGTSYNNPELNEAYASLMRAVNDEEYLGAVKRLQHIASEELFGFAVCWEQCFFPYRTDRFNGLKNYRSIGVVHAETFYDITTK